MPATMFTERRTDGRYEYHLPVPFAGFIQPTVLDNSRFQLDKEVTDDLLSFIYQNNISSFSGWNENAILYSIALQVLGKGKKCLLVYLGEEHALAHMQPSATAVKAEWWHSIEFTDGEELCRIFGIQSPAMFLESVNYSNKDLTHRYFYLGVIDHDKLGNYTRLYSSDVTNWFFIFCDAGNEDHIVSLLTDPHQKPELSSILARCSSVVNIQIGGDEGYIDYVLVQSAADLGPAISETEAKQLRFITAYENMLKECKPFDDDWKADHYKERCLEIMKTVMDGNEA